MLGRAPGEEVSLLLGKGRELPAGTSIRKASAQLQANGFPRSEQWFLWAAVSLPQSDFLGDISVARCGLVPSKGTAVLSASGAEGSWGRRGQQAVTRLRAAGSGAAPGAASAALSALQVRGEEHNKVCSPLSCTLLQAFGFLHQPG